jgi:hypothetical protein
MSRLALAHQHVEVGCAPDRQYQLPRGVLSQRFQGTAGVVRSLEIGFLDVL